MTTMYIIAAVVAWLACAPLAAWMSNGETGAELRGADEAWLPALFVFALVAPALVFYYAVVGASDRGRQP